MFKNYRELDDVVSLLVYCPSERSFLFSKEPSGEYWLPSSRTEKKCWKMTANKTYCELFNLEYSATACNCVPLRIYKIWLPYHSASSIYHAIYKVIVKSEVKKRKLKQSVRNKLLWQNTLELERQRAHAMLKSPELAIFILMAQGEQIKDIEPDYDGGILIEICENNLILSSEPGTGVVAPHLQLLQAAGYTWEDQLRLYCEFLVLCYPALYMSLQVFTTLMVDLGWQRAVCNNLFRSADINGRGGLTFLELMLWCAANEPATQHGGVPAEIRCRYIFRFFDANRDMKLEYVEFKELVAAARAARQLPVDALSVAKDADVCLRQLGIQPNSQLPLTDFLRGVSELRLRGTSSMLRAPRSISAYLLDLQVRERELGTVAARNTTTLPAAGAPVASTESALVQSGGGGGGAARGPVPDYGIAMHTVWLRKTAKTEMHELNNFDGYSTTQYVWSSSWQTLKPRPIFAVEAVSASTARLLSTGLNAKSMDVLGPHSCPVEAIAAVHYFAMPVDRINKSLNPATTRGSVVGNKSAWSWATPVEEVAMGQLLIKLAEATRLLCAAEPRLLRLTSPVYVVGDIHGNLNALLALETSLWPLGTALSPAKMLFLGDYVDRGPHGAEVMAYLMAAKVQRPNGIYLLRGNHETRDIQKMFTFYAECQSKYGEQEGTKIWNAINLVFDVLPLAAVIDDKVFCCHGGIPPPWVCPLISAINKVPVPLSRPSEQSTIAWELLWNDPVKQTRMTASLSLELTANEGFAANTRRGTGHVFDQTAIDRFLLANQLSHVVRAHEQHQNGFMCQLRGRLVSVFSSSHYCGGTNDSGVVLLEGSKVRVLRIGVDA